jgi:hypothetical protein
MTLQKGETGLVVPIVFVDVAYMPSWENPPRERPCGARVLARR